VNNPTSRSGRKTKHYPAVALSATAGFTFYLLFFGKSLKIKEYGTT